MDENLNRRDFLKVVGVGAVAGITALSSTGLGRIRAGGEKVADASVNLIDTFHADAHRTGL